jgi:hypothetical protein
MPQGHRLSERRLRHLVSTLRAFEALARQHVSFSLLQTTYRYQRQSGATLVARLQNDLLKC